MKIKTKQNKGITLLALIITIIVLLILATSSISLLMNGGIIDKTEKGTDQYAYDEALEQLKLAWLEYQMSLYTDNNPAAQEYVQNRLEETFGAGNVSDVSVEDGAIIAKIKIKGSFIEFEYDPVSGEGKEVKAQALSSISTSNYGDYIDLGKNIVGASSTRDDWRIIAKSNGKIYAILADYIPMSTDWVAQIFNSVESRDDMIESFSSSSWKTNLLGSSLQSNSSISVVGAPTSQMLKQSYLDKYNNLTEEQWNDNGNYAYINGDSSKGIDNTYIPHNAEYNGCTGYFTSTPHSFNTNALIFIGCDGRLGSGSANYYSSGVGVRPVVEINDDIQVKGITGNGKTTWSLVQ